MDFLEKLDYLMDKRNLNKSTLSKACDIPYTTIDGWYKKGYAGLKLTTLRKLSNFFGTSLDFWASEIPDQEFHMDDLRQLVRQYSQLDSRDQELVKGLVASLAEKNESCQPSDTISPDDSSTQT